MDNKWILQPWLLKPKQLSIRSESKDEPVSNDLEAGCFDKTDKNDVEIDTFKPCQRSGTFCWKSGGRIDVTDSWISNSLLRYNHSKTIKVHRTLKSADFNN